MLLFTIRRNMAGTALHLNKWQHIGSKGQFGNFRFFGSRFFGRWTILKRAKAGQCQQEGEQFFHVEVVLKLKPIKIGKFNAFYICKIGFSNSLDGIRVQLPGSTVVQKLNQGLSRSLGVLSCGGPFCLPAFGFQAGVPWRLSDGNPAEANKKVQTKNKCTWTPLK